MARLLVERACAKVNLTLRVLGKRADGYHNLDSLVAFAGVGDRLSLTPGCAPGLTTSGVRIGRAGDNLVLTAARELSARVKGLKLGHFHLDKRLPVAAGIGGGSADAAAALRLLARANGLRIDDRRVLAAARAAGADVPVCVAGKPRWMRGAGERLGAALDLPRLDAVLVHPGRPLSTGKVFAAYDAREKRRTRAARRSGARVRWTKPALFAMLAGDGNDLEPAAIALMPGIANVIAELRASPGCRLARMSGSGATCFGLFGSARAAANAARRLRRKHPRWWVRTTVLG